MRIVFSKFIKIISFSGLFDIVRYNLLISNLVFNILMSEEAFALEAEQNGDSNLENTKKVSVNDTKQLNGDAPNEEQQNGNHNKEDPERNGSAYRNSRSPPRDEGNRDYSPKNDEPRDGRNYGSQSRDRQSSRGSGDRFNSREREDNRDANPETYTQIYIASIRRETGENDLRSVFEKFGEIEKVTVRDHFAFIKYKTHEGAE